MKECKHTFRHWAKNKLKIANDIFINVIALTSFSLSKFKRFTLDYFEIQINKATRRYI